MNIFILSFALIFSFNSTAGILEAWKDESDPGIMSVEFIKKFSELPLKGNAAGKDKFWSGDYWPHKDGSINSRWNSIDKKGFKLISPTKAEAKKLTLDELSELSPSEKYDLFTGNYTYPLKKEVDSVAYPDAQEWEGICHGWAPAAMNYNEPRPKVVINPDGIKIPFGSADIKGLLSYYYAYHFEVDNTFQIGYRCFRSGILNRNTYCKEDLNAGAFHIIMTNRIGIMKTGFIADLDRFREVWNHPVKSYQSKITGRNMPINPKAAKGTVKVVRVKTKMQYISEVESSWEKTNGTKDQLIKDKDYEYDLELDKDGEIIGGQWISSDRPDFIWLMPRIKKFSGILSHLDDLLD